MPTFNILLNKNFTFETPIRPWNSSPSYRNVDRGQSVSPSNSSQRLSPCPRNSLSPDASSENSRIPSQASSEATHDAAVLPPDNFRSPKMCSTELPYDVPFPFHDNRLSSADSFRFPNSYICDPLNPYFGLGNHPLNPFQPPPNFLAHPFLGTTDPKLLLNNSGFGLISQQLHNLNGFPPNVNNKLPPADLHRMSTVQQLQFIQNHLQSLPTFLQPSSPYTKLTESKNQLSMLIQARKQPKNSDSDAENVKKDIFPFSDVRKIEEVHNKTKDVKIKTNETLEKNRKTLTEEHEEEEEDGGGGGGEEVEEMSVDNYEENISDSDELLSVGSVSPSPSSCQNKQNKIKQKKIYGNLRQTEKY